MKIPIIKSEAREPKKKFELQFYQLPKDVVDKAIKSKQPAQFAVLAVLYEIWFRDIYHRNPVKLPNNMFRALGISPQTKLRALRELESQGSISVQWREKKSPIVTLNWLK